MLKAEGSTLLLKAGGALSSFFEVVSLEEEEETTRSPSLSYSRRRGIRSSVLFRDVGRGSLLL